MKLTINQIPKAIFRSFSQIMLQKSSLTGLLFCLGIAINSLSMLLAALLAVVISIITATLCRYNAALIKQGVYGFNAALVGTAVGFFLPLSLLSLILIVIGAWLATVVSHIMLIHSAKMPIFTAPFIISTWCILLVLELLGIETVTEPFSTYDIADFYTVFRGLGQVMFQSYWLSGLIFFVALLVNSYKLAIWAVIGSGVGMLIARALGYSEGTLLIGGYGFNAALVAIALAQRYQTKHYLIFLGILLSVLFSQLLTLLAIPALTAPFVMVSWMIVVIRSKITGVYKLP
ncbi:urea transporter [Colwellia sp. C1TZA3]|uniref:urea transporter n=1 Tax=Colwellia sp. C1TZA3 TaxID=2508879 RepID=UPI0011B996B1|nr:urea transporter [Colwellia sp. C1TZA3]TWX71159.1 urea transporter [Colwellia sp. C1TZA3]